MSYGNDKDYEPCPPDYILRAGDRMRRTNMESASSLDWFEVADFDIGQSADYFTLYAVERRKVPLKANTFCSIGKNCMKNGSCYRITGRKKEFAAHYMQGDFVGFVPKVPEEWLALVLPWKEAKHVLPGCFKGN